MNVDREKLFLFVLFWRIIFLLYYFIIYFNFFIVTLYNRRVSWFPTGAFCFHYQLIILLEERLLGVSLHLKARHTLTEISIIMAVTTKTKLSIVFDDERS